MSLLAGRNPAVTGTLWCSLCSGALCQKIPPLAPQAANLTTNLHSGALWLNSTNNATTTEELTTEHQSTRVERCGWIGGPVAMLLAQKRVIHFEIVLGCKADLKMLRDSAEAGLAHHLGQCAIFKQDHNLLGKRE